ncbi:TauD/TfdA family dioxygenase [Streptomyces sp. HNM0645]|uniref:TauD/TfdA family dioxygenase n=1 Tax=Streptomyces sp. HNM0645 TaxID=2782343 RepID=UPI0024B77C25|nr:TauD/TfdA family dioxygenase [Streptomyces sp. HNM0645]MDI9889390.1 TauD/TfdA family dioxygenase [Streptomyces sp. HNM0645]
MSGYQQQGYATVQVRGSASTSSDLFTLAEALNLGAPFTPPVYKNSPHTSSGVSKISARPDSDHPFSGSLGQNLHCDGTLQHLGEVPTTILLCAAPAAEGGVTYLVDLVDAYAALRRTDSEAAEQLAHDDALKRTSGSRSVTGPAFAEQQPGHLMTRYSRTVTDCYCALHGHQAALERALAFMDAAARPGSAFRTEVTLGSGQALIFANDRVGHGRTAYRDDLSHPRLLRRGLFTARPCA